MTFRESTPLRRIFPAAAELTPEEFATEAIEAARARPLCSERPWLSLNMVASVDGRGRIDGRSGGLSGPADRALFHALRASADAVMFGATTANIENYGRMVPDADVRDWRVEHGLSPEPVAVCVSGELTVSSELPLLAEPQADVVVATASGNTLATQPAAGVTYRRIEERALAPLMASLASDHGVRSLLCEGGPHLNRSLLAERLVDEIYLTVSPMLVGAPAFPIVQGEPLPEPIELQLADSIESGGTVFMRYTIG